MKPFIFVQYNLINQTMAVEKKVVVGRLRALFPKAHLSKTRIDEIAERLSQIPSDEATQEEVDQLLEQYNTITPFEEIAKSDDRMVSYEKKIEKLTKGGEPETHEQETHEQETPASEDDIPEWGKELLRETKALRQQRAEEDFKSRAIKELSKSSVFKDAKESVRNHFISQFKDGEDLTEQVQTFEQLYGDMIQTEADNSGVGGPPPAGDTPTREVNKEIIGNLADELEY